MVWSAAHCTRPAVLLQISKGVFCSGQGKAVFKPQEVPHDLFQELIVLYLKGG